MDSQLLTVKVPQFWLPPLTFNIIGYLFDLTLELVLIFKSTGPGHTLNLVGLLGLRVRSLEIHFSVELALWIVISTA